MPPVRSSLASAVFISKRQNGLLKYANSSSGPSVLSRQMTIIEFSTASCIAATSMRTCCAVWRASSRCVAEFARFFRVQDLKGYLPEETEGVDNTLFVNNQSSMPMAHLAFGAGECIGYHPWHSHQHVQIVAAPRKKPDGSRNTGVDVYLPMAYSPLLGTAEFKADLLYGWRGRDVHTNGR